MSAPRADSRLPDGCFSKLYWQAELLLDVSVVARSNANPQTAEMVVIVSTASGIGSPDR